MRIVPTQLLNHLERVLRTDIRYLIRGNFWLFISRAIATGSGIALTIAFANLLPPETFGFYKYVLSIAGMLSALSLTGIVTALTNSIARGDTGVLRTTFNASVLWSLPASAVAFSIAAYYFYNHNIPLGLSLVLIAVCGPILSSAGNYRAIFPGLKDFQTGALWGIPRNIFPIIAILTTVFLTKDPFAIIAVYFLSNTATVVVLYWLAIWKYKVPKTAASTESTTRFAKYTSVLSFFMQVASQADQFLMWHFAGPAAVAYYSFATSPVKEIRAITGNISALAAPNFATRDRHTLRNILPLRIMQMFGVMVPITLLYVFVAPALFYYLFPKYITVIFLSQLYAVTLLLQVHGLVDTALVALEDVGMRNVYVAVGQGMKLILLFIGIMQWGVAGGIGALILSEIFNFCISLFVLYKKM